MNSSLNAREVYQMRRDVALGTRRMQSVAIINPDKLKVEVDGWYLTLVSECGKLDYCDECTSPDGNIGTCDSWQNYGSGPTDLLSQWERQQLSAPCGKFDSSAYHPQRF